MQSNQPQKVRTVSKFTLFFVVAFTSISLWSSSLLLRHDFVGGMTYWNTFRGFPFTCLTGSLDISNDSLDLSSASAKGWDYYIAQHTQDIHWVVRWSRLFLDAVFWTIVGCLVVMAIQQVIRREFTKKLALVLAILLFLLSSATLWWFWPDLVYPDPQLDEPTIEGQSLLPTSMLLTSIVENNATTSLKTPF
jgi:hypothetical protein